MDEFKCLKDKELCIGAECDLFMRPNDCAVKSWAISLERIAVALEQIVATKKEKKND